MYKINGQPGYIVQHRELEPLFCNNFKWNIIYKNIESLCYTPETNIVNQLYFNKNKFKKIKNKWAFLQYIIPNRISVLSCP